MGEPVVRKAAPEVSWIARGVTSAILALQAGAIILNGWLWGLGGGQGYLTTEGLFALVIAFTVFPALGVLGLVWAIVSGVRQLERRWIAATLLVVSLGMGSIVPPMFVSSQVGRLFRPLAQKMKAENVRRATERYAAAKRIHHKALLERFRAPRRVVEAHAPYLYLDNSCVVQMIDFSGAEGGLERFKAWAPGNLVGREVRIVLPSLRFFEDGYIPGGTRGRTRRRAVDPETRTPYGEVPAFVLLDGDLVNARFATYPARTRKFYDAQTVLTAPASSRPPP